MYLGNQQYSASRVLLSQQGWGEQVRCSLVRTSGFTFSTCMGREPTQSPNPFLVDNFFFFWYTKDHPQAGLLLLTDKTRKKTD